jgi:sulfur-oxidizing protein SoxY
MATPTLIRRRALLSAAALWPTLGHSAIGGLPTNIDHAATSPEWDKLRSQLFGERPLNVGTQSLVQLIVPLRAAYGASVPIKIVSKAPQTATHYAKRLILLVDKNPSAVAANIELTPALGQADFETRLRVDEYSHVRVITEWNDDSLHLDSRFVKVSGGCSAPPNRDSPQLIGQTRFRLPEGLKPAGQTTPAEVTVIHPNDTGFELNQVTVMYIPPHFVRSVRVRYDEQLLFNADTDFSVSENPSWRFQFVPRADGRGLLTAEVSDSKENNFSGQLDIATAKTEAGTS